MSWITAVADYLQSQSLGTQGTTLFIGSMPDTNVVTTLLGEYQGTITTTMQTAMAVKRPSLQVRVRGAAEDYESPRTRIEAIQTLLAGLPETTLGGIKFLRFIPSGTINPMGQDGSLRFEFTINFEVLYV